MVVNGSTELEHLLLVCVLLHHRNEFIRTWRCYGVVNGRDDVNLGFAGLIDEPRAGRRLDGEFKVNGVDAGGDGLCKYADAILFASGIESSLCLGPNGENNG